MATSTRALAVAFFAVVVAFVGSTYWVQRQASNVDADTLFISRDAAPGVQVISDLRAEIRELQARVIQQAVGRSHSDAEVTATRQHVDDLVAKALTLPPDPNEAVLFARLQAAIRAFDEAAERTLEQSRSGKPATALATVDNEVRPLGDVAGAAARELVDYNSRAVE